MTLLFRFDYRDVITLRYHWFYNVRNDIGMTITCMWCQGMIVARISMKQILFNNMIAIGMTKDET